jgi:hypothetical protein
MAPTKEDFQEELNNMFKEAQSQGKPYVDISAKKLHEEVGWYPNNGNHRMPVCCDVMKKNKKPEDDILRHPPKGNGATLVIRYKLPR